MKILDLQEIPKIHRDASPRVGNMLTHPCRSRKRMAIEKCTMSNTEMGSDNTTGGLSRERISTPMLTTTVSDPFLVPTTITPLINKHAHKNEEHVHKSSPLPAKFLDSTSDDDFHGGFPILEEVHP